MIYGATRILVHEGGYNHLKSNYGYVQEPSKRSPHVSNWRDIIDLYNYTAINGWKELAATKTGVTMSVSLHTPGTTIDINVSEFNFANQPKNSFTMAAMFLNGDKIDTYLVENCVISTWPAGIPGSPHPGGGMATFPMSFYSFGGTKYIKGA